MFFFLGYIRNISIAFRGFQWLFYEIGDDLLPYLWWGLFHKPTLRIPKKTHRSVGPPCGVKFYLKTGKCANLAPYFLVFNQNRNGPPPKGLKLLNKGYFLSSPNNFTFEDLNWAWKKAHIPFVSAGLLFRVSWATAVFVGKSPPATRNPETTSRWLEGAGSRWKLKAKQMYRGGPLSVINGVK